MGSVLVREVDESADTRGERFTTFCVAVEPRLRRALTAAYGSELGSEATADALSWAWEHFEKVERMDNPAGYLWRVGQTSVRDRARPRTWTLNEPPRAHPAEPAFEPALIAAVAALPERQRTAVVLVHGYGYSLSETALVLGCRIRTVRHHLDRGLAKLRDRLGVTDA